jgi:hypothetical protein
MQTFDPVEMLLQSSLDKPRQHRHTILAPLAVADGDLLVCKVNVLDAQTQTLEETKP